ncbi:MAG: diguanylate cyclase [Pseudomonadota bacterium]|nr:diguanylate cyclase [Pseudomonadota bacterium]
MFSIIPKDDPAQAVRISRNLLASAAYFTGAVMLVYVHLFQPFGIQVGLTETAVLLITVVISNITFYAILRSGLNKRFSDPSLTMSQLCVGIVVVTFGVYIAGPYRGVISILYPVAFTFGLFRLNTAQLLSLSVFTLVAFALMMALAIQSQPQPGLASDLAFQLIVLGIVLPWFSVLGGYISKLRQRLVITNRELQRALRKIQELAIRDDLTQLYNRRHLMEVLEHQRKIADRGGYRFCICILDLDHFKSINDRLGHLAGDRVLTKVAETLAQHIRGGDFIARFGGEEFVIILSDTNLEGAVESAERMRIHVHSLNHEQIDKDTRTTVSIGVTDFGPGESIDHVLDRADRALYQAKQDGRNRTVALTSPASNKITTLH